MRRGEEGRGGERRREEGRGEKDINSYLQVPSH